MKLKAFEYIVLLHPKRSAKGEEEGETQIISERQLVLAKDDKMVAMKATRAIDAKYENDLDRCEIIVRPF